MPRKQDSDSSGKDLLSHGKYKQTKYKHIRYYVQWIPTHSLFTINLYFFLTIFNLWVALRRTYGTESLTHFAGGIWLDRALRADMVPCYDPVIWTTFTVFGPFYLTLPLTPSLASLNSPFKEYSTESNVSTCAHLPNIVTNWSGRLWPPAQLLGL